MSNPIQANQKPEVRRASVGWSLLLIAVTTAAGCAGGAGTAVDTTEQPIVGGIETSLRPEIGLMSMGCTGTLITTRVGLTAAHCFGFKEDVQGQWISFNAADGKTYYFTMDRIHVFGTEGGSTDVAIFHLKADVPASIATPAAISAGPPEYYGRATVFGYGCTKRFAGGVGQGTKRYASFYYGQYTGLLCPGDSGGPAVLGEVGERGAIWGVNSGWTSGDDTHDIWGWVYDYREGIAAQMYFWDLGQ